MPGKKPQVFRTNRDSPALRFAGASRKPEWRGTTHPSIASFECQKGNAVAGQIDFDAHIATLEGA
jgi:hypothetical protein